MNLGLNRAVAVLFVRHVVVRVTSFAVYLVGISDEGAIDATISQVRHCALAASYGGRNFP
jgi:hypothetical protein